MDQDYLSQEKRPELETGSEFTRDARTAVSSDSLEFRIDVDPFIGRWNRLISTTNWEKGRIIHEWRAALMAVDAPVTEYSDENWSRIVGGSVSGQHAGRLRRVYERFGDVHDQYSGLYWSHFQAALDWDDAEMWLEGAVQNRWSVSRMRRQRWETLGGVKEDEPRDADVVSAEVDEDFASGEKSSEQPSDQREPEAEVVDSDELAEARSPAGPDFGDEDDTGPSDSSSEVEPVSEKGPVEGTPDESNTSVRPFAELPELPEDLAAAFEAFQLAILRHKAVDWNDVSRDDVLASLDALKTLVLAASE